MKKVIESLFFIVLSFFFISSFAYAADVAPNFGDSLAALLVAYKTHAGVAAIIVAVVQLLKSDLVGGLLLKINQKWIPWAMLALTGIGGAAQAVLSGKSWLQGIVDGFVTSGIAISIYESIKSVSAPKA